MINKYELHRWMMVGILLIGISFVFDTYLVSSAEEIALAATPEWVSLTLLPQIIGDGSVFVLNDTIYQAGGRNTTRIAEIYALDLKSINDGWQVSGTLNPARSGSGVTVVNDRAYIVGGTSGVYLANVDSFDGTELRSERNLQKSLWAPAVNAVQNRIYVAGGEMSNGLSTNEVWSAEVNLDGTLGDWRSEATLPRGLITRMAASERCIYVIGGKSGSSWYQEIYYATWSQADPTSITGWQNVGALPRPLALHAVAIDQNILYVLGGETTGDALNDQVYSIGINPDTCDLVGTWESSPLPGGGNRRLAVASRFGELYVLGGQTADGYTNAVWKGVLPVPAATLTFHKSAALAGDFDYGQLITYTLSYANPWIHPDGQAGVVITDIIPSGATFETCSADCEYITATDTLSWSIGSLAKDAQGEVTFTVRVDSPTIPGWNFTSVATYKPELTGTMSIILGSEMTYRITYTPTTPVTDGLLIATTLPARLFPKAAAILSEDPEAEIAFRRSSGEVLWRVPGVITESASVNVSLCVLTPFSTTEILTYTTLFQDVFTQTAHIYTQTIPMEQTGTIARSCTVTDTQYAWSATALPIYPTQIVTNRAWIYSNELGFWKPSDETVVTRYWPVKVFLPLTLR